MCGIVGFAGPCDEGALVRMRDTLAHRGPDGAGIFFDREAGVYLGHRRLAVIDVEAGAQPMHNETGSISVVFNGEIYNHAELRRELISAGHRFATDHSDTEVLVHGYEEWGNQLPARLNGMFAFAIFDKRRAEIFLARDRFGEKPLYYWRRSGLFGFASQMQALRAHPSFDEPLDRLSLKKYFAYGYVPSPACLWKNCNKLPGGCHLTYSVKNDAFGIERYWNFELWEDEAYHRRTEEDISEELQALLSQAVHRRLISDVPLGVFLSGGLDSSAVLSYAADYRDASTLDTFTIGFQEPSYDESAFARMMSGHVGSRHHEETLSIEALREVIGEALASLDEPIADPSIVPTFMLSRFCRKNVTVALSGDGGDELFAGYDPFKALRPAQVYNRLMPNSAHSVMRFMAERIPMSGRNMSFDFKIRRALAGLSYRPEMWNPVWMSPLEPKDFEDFFNEASDPEQVYEDAFSLWAENPSLSLGEQTLKFYTRFYLQDNILVKSDRAAMASSLETRAIFLDNDVVDFCSRLPFALKFRKNRGKFILREALSDRLPQGILARGKKGFGIPVSDWLKTVPETPPMAPLGSASLTWMTSRWAEHRSGKSDHRLLLWSWLAAQASAAHCQAVV